MTKDELNNLRQMIQRYMPKGTAWILVTEPPNQCTRRPNCDCEVQTGTNLMDEEQAGAILEGAAGRYENGTHEQMFWRPVER